MRTGRVIGHGTVRRGLPALAAAAALVTGAVPAAAASGWGAALAGPGAARAAGHATVPGVISTVAGGVGGPATATALPLDLGNAPCGIASGAGAVFIANGTDVPRVNPRTDWLTTPAGTGETDPGIASGNPATSANMYTCAVAVDHHGNLVLADVHHERVRVAAAHTGTFYGRKMIAGDIYTVAGNGTAGYSGDGGPATRASLRNPRGLAVDGAGNLVISDTRNSRIRVVAAATGTFYGQAMTAGDIYTVAGTGTPGFSGDGGPATSAELSFPFGVTVDHAGNLVIADWGNGRIRVVAESTGAFYGQPMTAGDIYSVVPGLVVRPAKGVAVDAAGNLVIADTESSQIRVWAARTGTFYGVAMTAGNSYTIAGREYPGFSGDGGPAVRAKLDEPMGVALDPSGNLVIDDYVNRRARVIANSTGTFYGQPMTAGDIYTVAGGAPLGFYGEGVPATRARFSAPGIATDRAGDMLISDGANLRVRMVPAATGTFYGQPMTSGNVYTVAGDGTRGFSGDGGPATSAELNGPGAAAVDGAGNLLISDSGNARIRVVAAATGSFYGQAMTGGDIYTLAGDGTRGFSGDGGPATSAELAGPGGVAVDGAGDILIADSGNNRIRMVPAATGTFFGRAMTGGDIYTVAGNGTQGFSGDGGPATSAKLNSPPDVAVDAAGNLLITDNGRIRVVAAKTGTFYGRAMTVGHIYTVAGGGKCCALGDGGPATRANLLGPEGVTLDAAGNLVIADTEDERIRVVATTTGTFYGRAMTAGDIYTVAGHNLDGFSGDGGPATSASMNNPSGVAVDGAGDILIADSGNSRIRMVRG